MLDRLLAAWATWETQHPREQCESDDQPPELTPAAKTLMRLSEHPLIALDLWVMDVCEALLERDQYDAVYLDGFSHASNPEPWSLPVLERLHSALQPGGSLVTYSSRSQLQRDLASAGFAVERLPGPAGKRETLCARKPC
jgi:tRNA U34 5-methylaminomethyl-2-thiouridine-forming methyltransferase MnmC